jgi:hypothetical protein
MSGRRANGRCISMQPEDISGGVPPREATNAGDERIPDSWVGQRVEAVVVRPVNPDQPGYSTSLTALTYEGSLEETNDRGIVASFSSEAEVLGAHTFYPWAAVLSIRLIEDQR